MKLDRIAVYGRTGRTERFDVVDVNAFLSASVLDLDNGAEAPPLVEIVFAKGGTCHLVRTSTSEFRRVMGFDPPGVGAA